MFSKVHVVIDIGGTKTRLAGAQNLGAFLEPVIVDTRQNYREVLDVLYAAAVGASTGASIDGVAIGVPGALSRDKRVLVHAPNLPKWNGAKLGSWLDDARHSGIHALQQFARTLARAFDAVRNAIAEPWSSGQAEDQINRLKTLKRAMFGRAGIELLRARMLPIQ
jgi:hypothetical protein